LPSGEAPENEHAQLSTNLSTFMAIVNNAVNQQTDQSFQKKISYQINCTIINLISPAVPEKKYLTSFWFSGFVPACPKEE
jgi:hypothetical protein